MRLKPVYRIVIFIGLCLLIAFVANAQPGDPSADPDVPLSGIEDIDCFRRNSRT